MAFSLNVCSVFSESKQILKAHSRHFLGLSVLFLLPISFLMIAAPIFEASIAAINGRAEILRSSFSCFPDFFSESKQIKVFVLTLLYLASILILSLCATGTITYSVFHGFFGRPVKFSSAIRSLSSSIWRLFFTVLCAESVILAFFVLYASVLSLGFRGLSGLGFQLSSSSVVVYAISLLVLGSLSLYLQVNWTLASVVSVVEASWGLEPLRRSTYLVKGMKTRAFCLNLFYVMGILFWLWPWYLELWFDVSKSRYLPLPIIQTICASAFLTLLFLHSIAANTVLYMYCKALHDELSSEFVAEFAQEYVSLPFDEQKIPHVVSVVQH